MTAILLVSGSTRSASSNTAALRTIHALAGDGIETTLYEGLAGLPQFNPDLDDEPLPAAVAELRATIDAADAVLLCTPEYAGSLPGSLKNLLDWTVKGGQLYGKRVGSLSVAAPGRGEGAQAHLRIVLGYVAAEVVDLGERVTVGSADVGPDGLVADPALRHALGDVLAKMATG